MVRLEIVADGQHVAGEIGDGVARRIGLLALGTAAQILHVGHGAQQAVAHVGVLERASAFSSAPSCAPCIGCGILGLGFRGIGRSCLILVGLTRIGLVVGHARLGEGSRLKIEKSKRDIDRRAAKIKGQGARTALPCSQPWG